MAVREKNKISGLLKETLFLYLTELIDEASSFYFFAP